MYHGTQKGTAAQSLFSSGAREMQQGSARSIDDKPKDAEISPFQAGSDCSLSAKQAVFCPRGRHSRRPSHKS